MTMVKSGPTRVRSSLAGSPVKKIKRAATLWRITGWDTVQQTLILVAALVPLVFGVGLLIGGQALYGRPTFVDVVKVAPPATWGVAFLVAGLLLLLSVRKLNSAELAALVVSALWAGWGLLTVKPVWDDGVITAPIAYLGLSAFSAVASIACSLRVTDSK